MRGPPLLLAICLGLAACATPEAPASRLDYLNALLARDGRPQLSEAEYEAQQQRQQRQRREHEALRLRNAGFPPATDVQAAGRSVVRATFSEPRLFFRMPGVTIEALSGGEVRVTLSSDGRTRRGTSTVPAAAHAELLQFEAAAFQPDPPLPDQPPPGWRRGDPLPPRTEPSGVMCHAWGATLERITPNRTEQVWAHGCNRGALTAARLEYAVAIARIAANAIPGCSVIDGRAEYPLERLARCFGSFDPATTDNP